MQPQTPPALLRRATMREVYLAALRPPPPRAPGAPVTPEEIFDMTSPQYDGAVIVLRMLYKFKPRDELRHWNYLVLIMYVGVSFSL